MTLGIDAINALGLSGSQTTASKKSSLGQEDFLKLMTTQMTHQDPTKPMENGDFLAQMAQFGTVAGIQDLQESFKNFADSISSDQALQASSLVGHYVSVQSGQGTLPAGGEIQGQLVLPGNSPNVTLKIVDAQTGETVRTLNLGNQTAGNVPFTWDGYSDGNVLAHPGSYKLEAAATIDGTNTALATQVNSKVDSVILGNGQQGVTVNLEGLGAVNFNQITQIL
ncbi:flagellar hook assembly protein FlgD [Methylomicrobium album]|uniref:Basal-body rod modification protein FlgD n=1 Tax=Methylomicrobium album BG8 TaxID=686340 RepID=H8GNF6_METAL|nr:flagellar hook assembly protein FlgD [Methylomicrobium album]EIC29549.1 flagellar hook capping protein [Methylomicrobium album BG8]